MVDLDTAAQGWRNMHSDYPDYEPEPPSADDEARWEAYRALMRFLMRAQGMDWRVVLVVTGKGGILHGEVPRWLASGELRVLASGASPAHIRHGGAGALYVAVKKKPR